MTEYPGKVGRVADDPKRPYKAYASTALAVVVAFVTYWIADADPFTAKDAAQGGVAALISAGLVGGTTFAVRNPKRYYDQRGALSAGDVLVVALVAFAVLVLVLWLR